MYGEEPEDGFPTVLNEESHAPLDEVLGDLGADKVDSVGGIHPHGLSRKSIG